jgi:hypothetical protein
MNHEKKMRLENKKVTYENSNVWFIYKVAEFLDWIGSNEITFVKISYISWYFIKLDSLRVIIAHQCSESYLEIRLWQKRDKLLNG